MNSSKPTTRFSARLLLRDVLGVLALGGTYAGVAKLSLAAAAAHHVVSSIWAPSGVALFVLVRYGLRFWPGVAIGAYAINAASGILPEGAGLIAIGNTLEAVAGAFLLTRTARINRGLDRVRDVLALAGYAGILSTMLSASIGVIALARSGSADPASALALWPVWWSGDALGVLVFAPLLFWWTVPETDAERSALRGLEPLVLFLILVFGVDFLFRTWGAYVYPLYPLVTWIALRLGRRGASLAVALVTVITTLYTIIGTGPFIVSTPTGNLFALQLFLVLLAVPSLLFAAARAEAQQAEARLRQSEDRYRTLARYLPDGCVVLYDRDLRLVLVEGPAVAAAGFVRAEVEGRVLSEIFDAEHAAALSAPFLRAFEGRPQEFEFRYKERTYLVRVLPLRDAEGKPSLCMALALDITVRDATLREVAESRSRLEVLSRRLLAAQEDERRRVAREVHDELGQALTGIKIGLGAMRTPGHRRNSGEIDRRIVDVSSTLDGAIEAVRRIVLRLRPGVLDNLGPLAALEWEVQQFTTQSGIPVRLSLPPEPLNLDQERSTTLYRTVQEALTNVMRHAQATAVEVTLDANGDTLVLQVTDDGRGISENELRNPRSMGILGMRERATACEGRLELRRGASGGTTLILTMPRRANGAHPDGH
ncbi:MAG: MASE1 domain-containing protein [Gemmatimonadales bacterium]